MKKSILNNTGMSMLGLLIALVIVIIISGIAFKAYMNTSKQAGGQKDPKSKAVGAVCLTSLTTMGLSVNLYKTEHNAYPSSINELADKDPNIKNTITNAGLWAQGGAPALQSDPNGGFTITGFCNDGNKYTYDSNAGNVSAQPFTKQQ
jgi:type II secretory pathway pseudopilin PulG